MSERDRIAIVTGGESGIGRAAALALARSGMRVALSYLSDAAAGEAAAREAGDALAVRCDVGDPAAVDALFARVESTWGAATVLVNVAGRSTSGKRVAEMSDDDWTGVLRTNLSGPFHTTRRFVRAFPAGAAHGRIVNVTSVHESLPSVETAEYCASKGGLRMFTRCVALEVAAQGITVNAIAPGTILTAMTQDLIDDPAALREHEKTIPLLRAGTVDDVAAAVLWLCSPGASYVTGTTLVVDGGMLCNVATGEAGKAV